MRRLIWLVFLAGLVLSRELGGPTAKLGYLVAVVVVIAVFRRSLVLALTRLAARFGMMRETIERMPEAIHLSPAPEPTATARPILGALAACRFVDAGAWNIAELPKIQVALMVQPDTGMLAAVESASPIGAHVNLHTLYPDGLVVSFTNSELPPPKRQRPNAQRVQFPRCSPGALVLRARQQRPQGSVRPVSIEDAPRLYEQLYADEIQFRKQQGA
jgi:hypothetical protein